MFRGVHSVAILAQVGVALGDSLRSAAGLGRQLAQHRGPCACSVDVALGYSLCIAVEQDGSAGMTEKLGELLLDGLKQQRELVQQQRLLLAATKEQLQQQQQHQQEQLQQTMQQQKLLCEQQCLLWQQQTCVGEALGHQVSNWSLALAAQQEIMVKLHALLILVQQWELNHRMQHAAALDALSQKATFSDVPQVEVDAVEVPTIAQQVRFAEAPVQKQVQVPMVTEGQKYVHDAQVPRSADTRPLQVEVVDRSVEVTVQKQVIVRPPEPASTVGSFHPQPS